MSEVAKQIVKLIERDFTGRRGLRQEWENIDEEIQDEIRTVWTEIVSTRIADLERQLAEAQARKQKWAKWIANHPPQYGGDHACSRCYPHSDIIKSGYVCVYHEATD